MNDSDRIIEAVKRGSSFLVTTHINPDGDAVGSELALYHLLRSLGKTVTVVNQDPVPQNLLFLPGSEAVRLPGPPLPPQDATFLVDCGQYNRAGSAVSGDRHGQGTIINIDHHATSISWADLNWIDPAASSTCEIIHRLITAMRGAPDLDMACCIYTGIMTDTGSFRYDNTSSRVLALAADLVDKGVDPAQIATHVYDSVPYPSLKLLGRALSSLQTTPDGRIAWMSLSLDDLRATGTTWEATEEFVNFARSIPSALVAVFFKAISDSEVKVSLRSRGRIDVSGYALDHQGGGHRNASGFVASGGLPEVIARTVADLQREVGQEREKPPTEKNRT